MKRGQAENKTGVMDCTMLLFCSFSLFPCMLWLLNPPVSLDSESDLKEII